MRRIILILIIAQFFSSEGIAQSGISSEGREFYLGLLVPSTPRQTGSSSFHKSKYNAYLLLTATANANVQINYFDASGTETGASVKIPARQGTQVQLDMSKFKISDTSGEHVQYSTCHIVSDVPISVQMVSVGTSAGGSYLALPVQCLGKQYVVQSYNDNPSGSGGMFSTMPSRGCLEVIATQDATQLQITPSTTTNGGRPGAISGPGSNGKPQPFTVGLSHGQTYTIYSIGSDANSDLTGTVITSNKPVVVLGGHEAAFTAGSSDQLQWTEGRDLMMEQMIPVECWDSRGYASIPFVDSKPSTAAGAGDELRVVTLPSNGNQVMLDDGSASATTASVPNYGSFSLVGTTVPIGLYDANDEPFGVMQYDQRMQGSGAPYPTPSMNSLVPKSRWKSNYYFFVQSTKYGTFQRYLYIIAPKADWNASKIMLSFNGGSLMPISASGVSIKRVWASIPSDSTMIGVAMSLNNSGAYYVADLGLSSTDTERHSTFFAYYNAAVVDYGYTAGGPPSYYDDVFSYANPLGLSYGEFGTMRPKMSATVSDECGYWAVCVRDSGNDRTGIRYVDLLNYPKNTYTSNIPVSVNARFDASVDPIGKNEILLPGTDGEFCFRVERVNPADTSAAAVEVFDNSGSSLLIQLRSSAALTASSSGQLTALSKTSFSFGTTSVDSPRCGILNIAIPSGLGAHEQVISSISIVGDTTHFRFSGTGPSLPISIVPGTPLQLPICFYPDDTIPISTTVKLGGACDAKFKYTISGQGASGVLHATDVQFPLTDSGDRNCGIVTLSNTGNRPLILQTLPVLSDTVNFRIDSAFLASLPITVAPFDSTTVQICFQPIDGDSHTATVHWHTNLTRAMEGRSKEISLLTGKGYSPEVEWSPGSLRLTADSLLVAPTATGRIYLANRGATKRILVHSIALSGLDSSEFSIVGNEYGVDPLSNFYIASADSMWLDILFHPNVSVPYPGRYADRSTYLMCTYDVEGRGTSNALVVAPLTGRFDHITDNVHFRSDDALSLNVFQDGSSVVLELPDGIENQDCSVEIHDVLGREVVRPVQIPAGTNAGIIHIPIPPRFSGSCFFVLTSGRQRLLSKLQIVH
ncbi:MAG: IgGFc-binding protein [Bacteroidetes bacterium]|nr:IgGFc-binding protein [Bacteroidota bacterium]